MMLWLRSLLFYVGMIGGLVVLLPFMPLVFPFSYRTRYWVMTRWGQFVIWWLALTCNLRYRVSGREHIPTGPAIILSKHQSAWETLALQRIFPPQTWVLKRSLLFIPIFGWGLALLEAIGIDRRAGRKALQQVVEQGTDRLRRGIWVVIFPEGTRTAPGVRGKYNIGGAMLAKKSGYPIVPVAHNAGEFWRRNSVLKYPGTIDVVVGPVIDPQGKDTGEINAMVENWIEDTMTRISTLPAPAGSVISP
ncbi:lysophospholipid acyltransferase family protein [Sulfurivermis fontis]|uniref:lysophospholipid acyltransferase family protein n=1 Tax=Sulfurivermis fontis TaxID=1972068 RepID=UPI000FD9F9F2|nr:lysophospholipid acyltransferase family protein [Sulfurivermis fontis]